MRGVLLVLLFLPTIVAGCRPAAEQPAEEPKMGQGDIEIRLAPVEGVSVRIAESFPPQIFVSVRGGLADSCTTFHDSKVGRSGTTINIEVTVQRPRDAVCAQVSITFEKNIALGSDFATGVTYTVIVNDAKPVAFTLP